jgi:hypothetical protein
MDIVRSGPGFPAEFITVSLRESRAAIEGFAGQVIGKAVFFPDDGQFLIERDLTVHHYEAAGAEQTRQVTQMPALRAGPIGQAPCRMRARRFSAVTADERQRREPPGAAHRDLCAAQSTWPSLPAG